MRSTFALPFTLAVFSLVLLPTVALATPERATPWQWDKEAGAIEFHPPAAAEPVLSTGTNSSESDGSDPAHSCATSVSAEEMGKDKAADRATPRAWPTPARRVTHDRRHIIEYTIIEEDGEPYLVERRREVEWQWTFPRYIGMLGLEFSAFTQFDHKDGSVGLFYRHLHSSPGPLFYGFELTPFSFGAVYDHHDFAALYSYQTRALGLLRLYLGVSAPKIYFELGAGLQFIAFRTADDYALIFENGYPRDEFSRWRAATRIAFGMELGGFGLEFGWTGAYPAMEFEYSAHTSHDEVTKASVTGMVYFTATFRIGERR